jgi:phosphoribosylformylglycinamidine synthase
VAATNCLNFGNPEKPEIMAQLSAAIDGIAEACTALGTPITGGNVSLYNETKGEGIYPTPVIGVVGILEDVSKAVPADFQRADEDVLLLLFNNDIDEDPSHRPSPQHQLGSSEFAKQVLGSVWGTPPGLNLKDEASLQKCLIELADARLLSSARDTTDAAIFGAVAEATFGKNVGFQSTLNAGGRMSTFDPTYYWMDLTSTVVVSCRPEDTGRVIEIAKSHGASGAYKIGETTQSARVIFHDGDGKPPYIDAQVAELKSAWSNALQSTLSVDTVTA